MNTKYTKEILEHAVKTSNSYCDVLRNLGLKQYGGGTYNNIKNRIKFYAIDVSHFGNQRHTKEKLTEIVKNCISMSEVLRMLGLRPGGGTQAFIKRKIKKYDIDISHFQGSGNRGSKKKKPWQEILIKRAKGNRVNGNILKKALIASGRIYRCEAEGCQIADKWLGKEIRLHVHHCDGDWLNDSPENLKFHCLNCHSQTPNYCILNAC